MINCDVTTNTIGTGTRIEACKRRRGRPRLPTGQALTGAQRCRRYRLRREDTEIVIDRCAYEELTDALNDLSEALDKAAIIHHPIGACAAGSKPMLLRELAAFVSRCVVEGGRVPPGC
jgi:transcription initiation factor TFIIIB Brf1 subunit/transcription initiation factor TFIIB